MWCAWCMRCTWCASSFDFCPDCRHTWNHLDRSSLAPSYGYPMMHWCSAQRGPVWFPCEASAKSCHAEIREHRPMHSYVRLTSAHCSQLFRTDFLSFLIIYILSHDSTGLNDIVWHCILYPVTICNHIMLFKWNQGGDSRSLEGCGVSV